MIRPEFYDVISYYGFQAMMYPGMQSLWSKWAPPHERSRLVGFAFGGKLLINYYNTA